MTNSTHVSHFSSLPFHPPTLVYNAGNLITTTETHRGFAFIDFDSAEDAAAAIDNMHESELYGRTLRCNIAKPNRVKEGSGRAGQSDHNSVLFLRLRWFILVFMSLLSQDRHRGCLSMLTGMTLDLAAIVAHCSVA